MDHNPDRICVWPGYFDAKTSRRNGRRVPRDSSVLKPDLEGLFYAARKIGLKKSSVKKMFPTPIVRMARKAVCGFLAQAQKAQSVRATKKNCCR